MRKESDSLKTSFLTAAVLCLQKLNISGFRNCFWWHHQAKVQSIVEIVCPSALVCSGWWKFIVAVRMGPNCLELCNPMQSADLSSEAFGFWLTHYSLSEPPLDQFLRQVRRGLVLAQTWF